MGARLIIGPSVRLTKRARAVRPLNIEAESTALPSEPGTVLLLEDDVALAGEIVDAFAAEGIAIVHLSDIAALRTSVSRGDAAALVMDRMVEGADSLVVLAELRAAGMRVPVVVISSLASVDERIRGLKDGGDDYLVKPFATAELVARVAALRRRAGAGPRTLLAAGPLVLDLVARRVTRAGAPVDLLPREFALLEYLMRHAGTVVTRTMLLEDVWHYRLTTHTNVVDVHVGNLRRKIERAGAPRLIETVRGIGFVLSAGAEP